MDLDAFTHVSEPDWERLRTLTRSRHLTGEQSDELVRLYQRVSGQLSQLRSAAPDPYHLSLLSSLLVAARARIAGAQRASFSYVAHFFRFAVPAALYRIRWWIVGVYGAFLLVAITTGVWAASHPEVMAQMGTPNQLKHYAEEAFAAYYSNSPAPAFAAQVWTNNAWLALQTVAIGWSGVFPIYMIYNNAVAIGGAGAIMGTHGYLGEFFVLIAPHGLLELTALFVAGAAGLKICWTFFVPGKLPRSEAIAQEGRAMIGVALGLVVVLAVSGLIEGFVPRMAIPGGIKIAIGVLAFVGFWAWVLIAGRKAVKLGETGDMSAAEAGDVAPTAA